MQAGPSWKHGYRNAGLCQRCPRPDIELLTVVETMRPEGLRSMCGQLSCGFVVLTFVSLMVFHCWYINIVSLGDVEKTTKTIGFSKNIDHQRPKVDFGTMECSGSIIVAFLNRK